MVDFAGWQMPIMYTSIVEEHNAVREQVGMFDIAHMGRLWFSGADASLFLDLILTNHVEQMKEGQVRYSLVCNEEGGILDDVLVYKFSDRYLLVVNGANREKIVQWIESQRNSLQFEFKDETKSSFMLAIQGPLAENLLQPFVACTLADIPYYCVTSTLFEGIPVVISRTGYTGEDGFELICDTAEAISIWQKLLDAGGETIRPCGLGCRDTLRLEAAMPLYGHEMDESVDPNTAGLSFGVKLNKADFIGKEAIEKIKSQGKLTKRVGVELAGRRIAREGATFVSGEETVGHVTSGTFSPTLEKSIAMGYLSAELAIPGTEIEVDIRGKREPAKVVKLPFYKRND